MKMVSVVWLAFVLFVLMSGFAGGYFAYQDSIAMAAPLEPASVVMCGKIATTGPIDYYFCETDFGDFFTNSMGFMAIEQ